MKSSLNLTIRFILEIAMLLITAFWGWSQGEGYIRFIFAITLPLMIAMLWGIFAVKDDPSRSGKTVVQTPGIIRLFMEFLFFGFACWALFDLGFGRLSLIMTIILLGHYIFSYKRIKWLLKQK